ncbi:M23 family metallopeptidase [Piscinibacter sp. HJYY11]|uniref:M23 family metallopeptidase n=1 Tax=Piscinibacter sp. HJYY11 TaxID=2801333 RepID=UPI001F20757C|nr:M23 family metallopeptidase [Piscinibacter sp. HJYY11]
MEKLERDAVAAGSRLTQFIGRHPRTLTSLIVTGLMGFGVTAFGIAPLAPDAADLPRRIVTEIVTPEDISSQLEALASHTLQLYRNDLTRATDTADSLLSRLSVADVAAAAFIRNDRTARKLLEGRAGKIVQVRIDESGVLEELVARYPAENSEQFGTHFSRLRITRIGDKFLAGVETAKLESEVRTGAGTIRSSLFAATDEAKIPDPVATQLAEMFSTDIDFRRELRRGDSFHVVYEALTADGEPITWNQASGRVLAAEFINDNRSYSAVWYQDAHTKGGYYGFDGESKRRAFLASPMEFSRVTSGFSMRMHPIHKVWRQHLGVDYGAPTGTPVRNVGDGIVEFAGWQNGYGNVVQVLHSNDRTTLYAHLSRIDVKKGQRVEQGTRIGAVGSTGWATGPHLHFEVKVKGQHQDPLVIAKTSEAVVLSPESRARFMTIAQSLRQQLDVAKANPQRYALVE